MAWWISKITKTHRGTAATLPVTNQDLNLVRMVRVSGLFQGGLDYSHGIRDKIPGKKIRRLGPTQSSSWRNQDGKGIYAGTQRATSRSARRGRAEEGQSCFSQRHKGATKEPCTEAHGSEKRQRSKERRYSQSPALEPKTIGSPLSAAPSTKAMHEVSGVSAVIIPESSVKHCGPKDPQNPSSAPPVPPSRQHHCSS